jgi:biotin carboxyl carrier protein
MDVALTHGERLNVSERVVVAPAFGVFRASAPATITAEGEILAEGQEVGHIEGPGLHVPVTSRFAGFMMELMAHDGERVREGQPIAWLRSL